MLGVCGLGNMGNAIAVRLASQTEVIGYDLDPTRCSAAQHARVEIVESAAALARAPAVVLSLPSLAASEAVVRDLAAAMLPGSLIIETSTVTPSHMGRIHGLCRQTDIGVVDAAILSGVGQMIEGHATILVGGSPADLLSATPIFTLLAERIVALGELGSGMAAKLVNNAVSHATMVVLTEAFALAVAAGVAPEQMLELLSLPDGGLSRPLTHRIAERVLQGDYSGGMACEIARKDSILALEYAQDRRVPLFAIQAAHSVYDIAVAHGLGKYDYSVIAKLWEQWIGSSFARPPIDSSG